MLELKISELCKANYMTNSKKMRIKDGRKTQKKGFSLATKKTPKPEKSQLWNIGKLPRNVQQLGREETGNNDRSIL